LYGLSGASTAPRHEVLPHVRRLSDLRYLVVSELSIAKQNLVDILTIRDLDYA
jgi:hypothetical protein